MRAIQVSAIRSTTFRDLTMGQLYLNWTSTPNRLLRYLNSGDLPLQSCPLHTGIASFALYCNKSGGSCLTYVGTEGTFDSKSRTQPSLSKIQPSGSPFASISSPDTLTPGTCCSTRRSFCVGGTVPILSHLRNGRTSRRSLLSVQNKACVSLFSGCSYWSKMFRIELRRLWSIHLPWPAMIAARTEIVVSVKQNELCVLDAQRRLPIIVPFGHGAASSQGNWERNVHTRSTVYSMRKPPALLVRVCRICRWFVTAKRLNIIAQGQPRLVGAPPWVTDATRRVNPEGVPQ